MESSIFVYMECQRGYCSGQCGVCVMEYAYQIAGVFLCVHIYRAFRTVQAALQTATAAVSSHELISCGNGGTLTGTL